MKFRKVNPKTLRQVLITLSDYVTKDLETSQDFCTSLNNFLDELLHDDFFGTEGQCDPRGEHRD